jgi:hypothetical protein
MANHVAIVFWGGAVCIDLERASCTDAGASAVAGDSKLDSGLTSSSLPGQYPFLNEA